MGKKLVWLMTDENGESAATAVVPGDPAASASVTKKLRAALDAIPSALLIGAEEREELWAELASALAQVPPERRTGDVLATVVWDLGWRKVAAVDREALVEEIAKALLKEADIGALVPSWEAIREGARETWRNDARALLARVEGEAAP